MGLVRIYVFARPDPLHGLRVARWTGDPGWPGAPGRGDTWFHCEGWGGETVDRVSFLAPVSPGQPCLDVEVRTGVDVLAHLVDVHGFEGVWATSGAALTLPAEQLHPRTRAVTADLAEQLPLGESLARIVEGPGGTGD